MSSFSCWRCPAARSKTALQLLSIQQILDEQLAKADRDHGGDTAKKLDAMLDAVEDAKRRVSPSRLSLMTLFKKGP